MLVMTLLAVAYGPGGGSAAAAGASSSDSSDSGPHRHLLVGSTGLPLIASLSVDRDGRLSSVPGSPFDTGVFSLGVAITPDARTVYSTHTVSGTIVGYRIADDGSLTEIPGARISGDGPAVGVAVSPDGQRLFATVGMAPIKVRSYDIAPTGSLSPTAAAPVRLPGGTFSQVSIRPDGRHLVVTSWGQNTVQSYAIAPDASLTSVGEPIRTGGQPVMPVFTPDGRFVYVSNELSNSVTGYAVAEDGTLTSTPGSPYPAVGAHGAVVSDDGRHLYVNDAGGVGGFGIGSDGALTPLPGSPYDGGSGRITLSPDGRRVFVLDGLSSVRTLVRNADGTLQPSDYPSTSTGVVFSDGQIAAITPNIGPDAELQVVETQGLSVTFSAAGSTDRDGRVARYHWDFGDGHQETTTSPEITHRFESSRERSVTVRVVDDEGCSTQLIYTGTTATCAGSKAARAHVAIP